jgi:hypothetical protein
MPDTAAFLAVLGVLTLGRLLVIFCRRFLDDSQRFSKINTHSAFKKQNHARQPVNEDR